MASQGCDGIVPGCLLTILCAAAAQSLPESASSQDEERLRLYQIEAGPLGRALDQLATQSSFQILYEPDSVAGHTAPELVGELSVQGALYALLRDSGLVPYRVNRDTIVLRRAPPSRSRAEEPQTGTIRGTVTLPNGAAVAGVTVTATSPAQPERRTLTAHTDEAGEYSLCDLPPGLYTLDFELQGMVPVLTTATVYGDRKSVV